MTTRITPPRILRLPEAKKLTGMSRTTLYEWMKTGRFPQAVQLGPRAIGWRESDIEDWLRSREPRKVLKKCIPFLPWSVYTFNHGKRKGADHHGETTMSAIDFSITVTASELDDVEEQGNSLSASYQVTMRIGQRQVVVDGWYQCGWIAPGASQDLDGSGLANWGSSQPGGWSVCDGDGQVSGRPTVEVGEDDDGAPSVLIQPGYGMGEEIVITCADLGIVWPDGDDVNADDEDAVYEWAQTQREARENVQAAADAISTALDEAIPPPPAEPDGEQVFDRLPELVRGGDDLPVRAGKYLGCDVRIAIRDGDDYTSYHPDEAWEGEAERVMGEWVLAAVRAQVAEEE